MSDSNEHISKEKTNTKTSLAEDINSKLEKYKMDSLNELEKKADEFSQKAKKDLVIKKSEEEKNSEDKQISQNQYIINRQQMFKEAEAQKFENLKRKQKFYDDLLNNIIDNWNNNQENFINYYTSINDNLSLMLDSPCIVSNQDNIIFIFKFLCSFIDFLKDKLKTIPLMVLTFLYNLNECQIFSKNPKIVKY